MAGRQNTQEQTEIAISPATEEQMKRHDPSRVEDQLNPTGNRLNLKPPRHPSTMNGVVGSTDQEANKDMARGSGFVVGSTDNDNQEVLLRLRLEFRPRGGVRERCLPHFLIKPNLRQPKSTTNNKRRLL